MLFKYSIQEHYFVLTAIPALRPVVFDLFLLRGGNKPDISRDLETQREVLVSMLLRLIQYYQVRLHYSKFLMKYKELISM